jgi:hypothetical protein
VSQLRRGRRSTVVRAGIEDAQARCHLKAFLFEQAVAFLATASSAPLLHQKAARTRPDNSQAAELADDAADKIDLLFGVIVSLSSPLP